MTHRLAGAVLVLGTLACFGPMRVMAFPAATLPPSGEPRAIIQALALLGYDVQPFDPSIGVISTGWREYTIPFGAFGTPMPVRERVQVLLHETGTIVRFDAQCNLGTALKTSHAGTRLLTGQYEGGEHWDACKRNDKQTNQEITDSYARAMAALGAIR